MTCIFILPEGDNWAVNTYVDYFVNGYEIEIDFWRRLSYVYLKHTTLFHIPKLNELSKRQYEYIMDKVLLKNEWIHVKFTLQGRDYRHFNISEEEKKKILSNVQMGIHVWKEKSNTEEENVVFTDPYISKTKSDEYLNDSLSQEKEKKEFFNPYKSSQKDLG
jgi:hypothetical protein